MKIVNIKDLPLGKYKVKYYDEWIEAELVNREYVKIPEFKINIDGKDEYVFHDMLDSSTVIPLKPES